MSLTRVASGAFSFSMRRVMAWMIVLMALPACAKSSGSSGASASSTEAGATAASSGNVVPPALSALRNQLTHGGPHAGPSQCDPTTQAAVCSPDGKTQLSCNMGMWKTVHDCDGPAGCKGSGDDIVCDMKPAKEGDPCTGGLNMPRCNDDQTLMQCMFGKWKKLVCSAPGHCRPPKDDMPAGCRL
jgi:hypothetical protein